MSHLERVHPNEPVRWRHNPRGQRHHRVVAVDKDFALAASAAAQYRRQHKLIEHAAVGGAATALIQSVGAARLGERLHAARRWFAEAVQIEGGIVGPACANNYI